MNIVITGASRGIGYATALELVRAGHQVLALSRNEQKLKALKHAAQTDRLQFLAFDLSNFEEETLLNAVKNMGGVDAVINNAGYLVKKDFSALSIEDWQMVYEVNVFGPVRLIQALTPFLKASEQAHIVNIGSMGGFQGSGKFPGLSAYSSSKGALSNLTECLAEEFKDENIKVNCLALGAVQTEMLAAAFPGYQAPMTSEEMASFMAYFVTEGHRFFNGKVLPVSGSTP